MTGSTTRILGVGRVVLDHVVVVPKYPRLDSKTIVSQHWHQVGGPVPVALSTAAHFGIATRFIGSVGQDESGAAILAELKQRAIDVSSCVRQGTTGFAHVWTEASSGLRTVACSPGSDIAVSNATVLDDWLEGCEIFHTDGTSWEVAVACAQRIKAQGGLVVLDAGSRKDGMEHLFPKVDLLVASDLFCSSWFGDVQVATSKLLALGCHRVIRTHGSGGATYCDSETERHFPAVPISPVDTTGAGDIFCGALLRGLAAGWEIGKMMRFANCVAGYACQFRGNRSFPSDTEIDELAARTIPVESQQDEK